MKEGLQILVFAIGDNGTINTISEEELNVF